jgi:uncharacterized protein (TIGR03435 family)
MWSSEDKMGIRNWAGIYVLILLPFTCSAQSAGSAPADGSQKPAATALKFAASGVHRSPHTSEPWFQGPLLEGDRYLIRQATMVNLIANAYSIDAGNVQGGPSWLEYNRYDIDAKTAPATSEANQKLMLQALLAERFHLAVHNGTAPIPAYVLRVGKDKPKLKPAENTSSSSCDPQQPPPGSPPQIDFVCHNQTMEQLARLLRNSGGGGYMNQPVVDETGLEGAFDFELKWTPSGGRDRAGAASVSIFDALADQLGLKLVLETAPRPVLLVDNVNEAPSPDAPGVDKALPPLPPPDFEVAVVNPYKPGEQHHGQFGGGHLNVHGLTLRDLITVAWDLNDSNKNVIANEPPWLAKDRWDIEAKMSDDDPLAASNKAPQVEYAQMQQMFRTLLAERFNLHAHMEDRLDDAYSLVAVSPKLTPADPKSRTRCTEGPGPDGKDPRMANPILNRLMTCQNMTMAQLGEQFQSFADGYIYNTVVDKTGLKGGYNFTLSFSSVNNILTRSGPAAGRPGATEDDSVAPDPSGAVSLFEAVRRELGLKLEKEQRPVPVLVIDHIDENPTPN